MWLMLIAKGFALGLLIAIPLGPVGALCIQRTLNKGYKAGLLCGLGSACADFLFALIAGLGISVIIIWLLKVRMWIQIGGSFIFMAMAYKVFYTNPAIQARRNRHKKRRLFEDFIATFFLTLSNPTPVFVLMAAFAAFIVQKDVNHLNIMLSIVGVFIGSLSWWVFLMSIVNMFRNKIRLRHLLRINKVTGVVVFVFAIVLLIQAFRLN